jgi:hypothetical protein
VRSTIRRWLCAASLGLGLATMVALGASAGASAGAPTLPPPKFGRSFDIGLISGVVIVRPAAGRSFRLGAEDRNIPVGSEIDTRRGAVDFRSARDAAPGSAASSATGPIQDAHFSRGLFRVIQRTDQGGLTTLDLVVSDKVRRVCGLVSAAKAPAPGGHLSSRVLQTLRASDNGGSFRTRGRYSAATVRGTIWDTTDRCDGTLTVVHRGTVEVDDFALRRTIIVHAGHRYLAKALARSVPQG